MQRGLGRPNRNEGSRSLADGTVLAGLEGLPPMIAAAGQRSRRCFIECFTAIIRNKNTRLAYARAVGQFFACCEDRGLGLAELGPVTFVRLYKVPSEKPIRPTVKQHLAALRMLFDWLVVGQVLPVNPAAAVRGAPNM